jgi:hypothetical protein
LNFIFQVLPRIFTGFIVCFWLLMTALLVRLEVSPSTSDLLSVPPAHLFKLMFTHGQTSELDIDENGSPSPIGTLTLRPKSDADSRTLSFSGNVSVRSHDSTKRQRYSWDGLVEMDSRYSLRSIDLTVGTHDPTLHLHIGLDQATHKAEYEIRQGNETLRHAAIPLDQAGAAAILKEEFGIDPSVLQNLPGNVGAPTLTAKQTEMKIRSEKVVAYLLTVKQGETTLGEIYISQLGQVLAAKTIFGYSLNAEDTLPPP